MSRSWSVELLPVLPTWLIAILGLTLVVLLALGSVMLRERNVPRKWITALGILRLK